VAIAPFASSERNEISFPLASFNQCGKANKKKVISGLFDEIFKQRRGPKLSFGFTTWERLADGGRRIDRKGRFTRGHSDMEAGHQPSVGYTTAVGPFAPTLTTRRCAVYHIEVRRLNGSNLAAVVMTLSKHRALSTRHFIHRHILGDLVRRIDIARVRSDYST
jgi:hypothetical protein